MPATATPKRSETVPVATIDETFSNLDAEFSEAYRRLAFRIADGEQVLKEEIRKVLQVNGASVDKLKAEVGRICASRVGVAKGAEAKAADAKALQADAARIAALQVYRNVKAECANRVAKAEKDWRQAEQDCHDSKREASQLRAESERLLRETCDPAILKRLDEVKKRLLEILNRMVTLPDHIPAYFFPKEPEETETTEAIEGETTKPVETADKPVEPEISQTEKTRRENVISEFGKRQKLEVEHSQLLTERAELERLIANPAITFTP